jgi:hypothetical protein
VASREQLAKRTLPVRRADIDLGQAEDRILGREEDVTRGGNADSMAEAVPVDRRNDRNGGVEKGLLVVADPPEPAERAGQTQSGVIVRWPGLARSPQVSASGERPSARTGDDGDPDVPVRSKRVDDLGKLFHIFAREDIERRVVDRDDGYVV